MLLETIAWLTVEVKHSDYPTQSRRLTLFHNRLKEATKDLHPIARANAGQARMVGKWLVQVIANISYHLIFRCSTCCYQNCANRRVIFHGFTRLRLQERLGNVPHRYHTRNLVDRPSPYSVIGYVSFTQHGLIL